MVSLPLLFNLTTTAQMFRQPSAKVRALLIRNAPHSHQKKLKKNRPRNTHIHHSRTQSDCLLLRRDCFDSRRHSDPSFEGPAFLQFFVPPQHISSRPPPKTAFCSSAPVSSRTFLDRSTELMPLLSNTSEITRLANKIRTVQKGNLGKLLW